MKNKICLLGLLLLIMGHTYAADFTATLKYLNFDELTTPVTGVVNKTAVLGQRYSKDSQLAIFDSTVINSKIKNLKLEKQLKQKSVAEAEREFQRSQELYEGTMLSDHELKLAEINFLKTKNSLAEVGHKLTKLQWKKQFYRVKAPYDGYVIQSHIYPGKYVANRYVGTPILSFVRNEMLDIELQASPDTVVNIGAELNINYKGTEYKSKVVAVKKSLNQVLIYSQINTLSEQLPPQGSLIKVIH